MNIWFTKEKNEFVYSKNGCFFIGITQSLLNTLGNPISAELPKQGEYFAKGEIFGFIESQTKAMELFMPISGSVDAVNKDLSSQSDYLWLIKVTTKFFEEDKIDLVCYDNKMGDF